MAFFCASSTSPESLPVQRTRAGPLDSQNAMPNCICGTVCTIASCRSSIVLMKCDWPRMKLRSAGLSIRTVVSSTAVSFRLRPAGRTSVPLTGDVVLELFDDEPLLGDRGLDQVADRDEADQPIAVHDGKVAQPVFGHQRHALLAGLV